MLFLFFKKSLNHRFWKLPRPAAVLYICIFSRFFEKVTKKGFYIVVGYRQKIDSGRKKRFVFYTKKTTFRPFCPTFLLY